MLTENHYHCSGTLANWPLGEPNVSEVRITRVSRHKQAHTATATVAYSLTRADPVSVPFSPQQVAQPGVLPNQIGVFEPGVESEDPTRPDGADAEQQEGVDERAVEQVTVCDREPLQ